MNAEASALVTRHFELLVAPARGPVLDLACGRGRHAAPLAEAGARVIALDRSADHLAELAARVAGSAAAGLLRVRADLEANDRIPLRDGSCGSVLVFRYLHRPLCGEISRVLRPGGLLLYETFTTGQRAFGGGPRRPEFLLEPGELPELFPGLSTVFYDERVDGEAETALASLVAEKPG